MPHAISDSTLANAIRVLAADAVEQAQSGHPGMPLGMADIATVLWHYFLKHDPNQPTWINRDRFVLSNGHGSMLLYALLHLTGYNLTIQDLKNFRQLHSNTPGHPEYDPTLGVEATTGPLAQGLGMAVGMALAEALLRQEFNRPAFNIISHYTYCFVGDGCLMEGLSHEVASLAGALKLNKLIVFWDNNGISIDGAVIPWFNDNTALRFQAYNWQVIAVDGHNFSQIHAAITKAQNSDKPTLINCKTTIGFGSQLAGSHKCHGAPLGKENTTNLRKLFNFPNEPFSIPDEIYTHWDKKATGAKVKADWQALFDNYSKVYPDLSAELLRRINKSLPNLTEIFDTLHQEFLTYKNLATRQASKLILNQLSKKLPELIGGSADLGESTGALHDNATSINAANLHGNYLHYGVREFGMAAIMNGLALHHGFIPFGATFLAFADYAKNAIRMSALMHQQVIYILTHDSIGLGEDGPTHQPVEHLEMLRAIPNLQVWRPADATETIVSWEYSLSQPHIPSCIILSRQSLPVFSRTNKQVSLIKTGGYTLLSCTGQSPDAIIICTGSETQLGMDAAYELQAKHNKAINVVSMPCIEVFLTQELAYQAQILPQGVKKIVIEASNSSIWYKLQPDAIFGVNTFGYSAPYKDIYEHFGLTVKNIVSLINKIL